MKISKWIMAMLIAAVSFVSCSKDKDDNKVSIDGYWTGTYVNDASGQTFYYRLHIKSNGDLEEVDNTGAVLGTGEWELDPSTNVFMAVYEWNNGQDFSLIAAFDPQAGKLVGNWGYNNSNTDGGSFELEKDY